MTKYLIAGLLVAGFATAAAAEETKYFLVYDNQGLCSVLEGSPSEGKIAFGNPDGFDSEKAARDALEVARNDPEKCKGVVE
jgi:hypothetical protein